MAEEKKEAAPKTSLDLFREKLRSDASAVQSHVLEGLKSASGKVRSLAIKVAFRTQDHSFIKKNVLPLVNSDKSKKVLRTISGKITRKELQKKVEALMKKKEAAPTKAEGTEAAAEAPQA